MISDSFKMTDKEGFFYEVTGKNIKVSNAIDPSLIGANASAEEAGEDAEDTVETKIDIIVSFKLQPTQFDKKSYQVYIKDYIKALLEKIKADKGEDAAEDFKKRAGAAIKTILGNFKNWEFFTGESQNADGMVVLMDYLEDGITPYFWFLKDGLDEEKC